MLSPWLRQLDSFWLILVLAFEVALPLYLIIGVMWARMQMSERLGWQRFPSMVPLLLAVVPAVAALHQWAMGDGLFAVIYPFMFVLVGMRAHILFYDCALPFEVERESRWFKFWCALQIFWWLQAPAAAFNGLDWPRGLVGTQLTLVALTTAIVVFFALAELRARRKA